MSSAGIDACFWKTLELVDRLRPVDIQEARERTVREQAAAGLAARAVVRLVLRVHDALHRRAAVGAGEIEAAVHGHLRTKGRDFLRKLLASFLAQPLDPFVQHRLRGLKEALDL